MLPAAEERLSAPYIYLILVYCALWMSFVACNDCSSFAVALLWSAPIKLFMIADVRSKRTSGVAAQRYRTICPLRIYKVYDTAARVVQAVGVDGHLPGTRLPHTRHSHRQTHIRKAQHQSDAAPFFRVIRCMLTHSPMPVLFLRFAHPLLYDRSMYQHQLVSSLASLAASRAVLAALAALVAEMRASRTVRTVAPPAEAKDAQQSRQEERLGEHSS